MLTNEFDIYGDAAYEDGQRVPVESCRGRAELLARYMADFHAGEQTALENLEWMEENFGGVQTANPSRNGGFQLKVALVDLMAVLVATPPARLPFVLIMLLWRLDQPCFDDLINHQTPADLYRRMGVSKEMAYRLANEIGDGLKLPRRKDQRNEAAREKMSDKRTQKISPP